MRRHPSAPACTSAAVCYGVAGGGAEARPGKDVKQLVWTSGEEAWCEPRHGSDQMWRHSDCCVVPVPLGRKLLAVVQLPQMILMIQRAWSGPAYCSSCSSSPAATGTACRACCTHTGMAGQLALRRAAPGWSSMHTAGKGIPQGQSLGSLQHEIPLPPAGAGPQRTWQCLLLDLRARAAAWAAGSGARLLACMACAGCCRQLQTIRGPFTLHH